MYGSHSTKNEKDRDRINERKKPFFAYEDTLTFHSPFGIEISAVVMLLFFLCSLHSFSVLSSLFYFLFLFFIRIMSNCCCFLFHHTRYTHRYIYFVARYFLEILKFLCACENWQFVLTRNKTKKNVLAVLCMK